MNLNKLWERFKAMRFGPWLAAAILLLTLLSLLASDLTTSSSSQSSTQEARIAQVLSAIEGVGKVEVALYYGPQATSSLLGSSDSSSQTPIGAVIVAQGAEDISVRLALSRAVTTLLGLPSSQVEVFPMEKSGGVP